MITITITTTSGDILEQTQISTFDPRDYHGVAEEQIAGQIVEYAKDLERRIRKNIAETEAVS